MSRSLDFAEVKERANFEQILRHYGIKIAGRGKQRTVLCPFHQDRKPSLSISLERKVFHCFGCGASGSVLDFVARIENVSIRDAAARVEEICGVGSKAFHSQPYGTKRETIQSNGGKNPYGCRPLPFKLELDSSHPYLLTRGITRELAAEFGLGYCGQGDMKGRVCIPIHDECGVFVGCNGRWASDDIPQGVAKYLLPRGFEKRRVLFGLHRVIGAERLALVEGCWSVFRLYALDIAASALMGRTLSTEQESLLLHSGVERLALLLDGDRGGRTASAELVQRLSQNFFVRNVVLPDGAQPDTVAEQFLTTFFHSGR
jgi:DNA primase